MPPPDRWSDYEPLGDVIAGTKLIAFKVPLKKEILSSLGENEKFGPHDVIQKIKEKGKALGLVIDTNYTDKYYHKGEFCRQNIEHEKIYTEGHFVPKDAVVYRFFDVVEKFVNRMETDDVVIGVHCTHGVNRTGYIVCRYMIERLGFDPTEALNAFSKARGHPIERQNYIDDLLERKFNPHYVIGDHPPVLKEGASPSGGKHNRRNRYRNKRLNRNSRSPMKEESTEQRFNEQNSFHEFNSDGRFDRYRMHQNSYQDRRDCYGYDYGQNHYGERSYIHRNGDREKFEPYPRPRYRSSYSFPPRNVSANRNENSSIRTSHYNSHPNVHIPSDEY